MATAQNESRGQEPAFLKSRKGLRTEASTAIRLLLSASSSSGHQAIPRVEKGIEEVRLSGSPSFTQFMNNSACERMGRMGTILVTGGAGFIGCNFVGLALSQTNFKVVVLDKLTYAGNLCSLDSISRNARFAFVEGDISDRNCVDTLLRQHRPLWVVNFAAETHVDRSIDDPRPFVNTNIVGTSELLEASRRHWMELDSSSRSAFRFLHISTDEVYGTLGATGLFEETTPYSPNSPYAASKAGSDHLVRAYYETYGLPVVITNCSNNYGPFQFPEKLIPLMLLNAMEGKPLPIYGDGGNVRDWLYVEDHCSGILVALEKGRLGEKYNIGGRNERTNLQIVDQICAWPGGEADRPPKKRVLVRRKASASYDRP